MTVRSLIAPLIGVKLGQLRVSAAQSGDLQEVVQSADYIEYPAPVSDLSELAQKFGVEFTKLRPHSVNMSSASARAPSGSLLTSLLREVGRCQVPFLGEHIGVLNSNANGPSVGYILPPALNLQTAQTVASNVEIMQNTLGLPLALENPNLYVRHSESTMTWAAFVRVLSELLPSDTGWLLDFAHLVVSQRNLREGDLAQDLQAYADSGRPIFEMHIAQPSQDSSGVTHDDHGRPLGLDYVQNVVNALHASGLWPHSVTLEREITGTDDFATTLTDLMTLRQAFEPATFAMRLETACQNIEAACLPAHFQIGQPVLVEEPVRAAKEKSGRRGFLGKRLRSQLSQFSQAQREQLWRQCGFSSEALFLDGFWDWLTNINQPHTLIPYFSWQDWDGIDLLMPVYQFFLGHSRVSVASRDVQQRLLLEMGVRAAIVDSRQTQRRGVYLEFLEEFEGFEAGRHALEVDSDGQVVASLVEAATSNGIFFSTKGVML